MADKETPKAEKKPRDLNREETLELRLRQMEIQLCNKDWMIVDQQIQALQVKKKTIEDLRQQAEDVSEENMKQLAKAIGVPQNDTTWEISPNTGKVTKRS